MVEFTMARAKDSFGGGSIVANLRVPSIEICITLLSLNRRWVAKGFSFDGQFYTDGYRSLRLR